MYSFLTAKDYFSKRHKAYPFPISACDAEMRGRAKSELYRKSQYTVLLVLISLMYTCHLLLLSVNVRPVSSALNITLKWARAAGTGSTAIGPLAADLNGDGFREKWDSGS